MSKKKTNNKVAKKNNTNKKGAPKRTTKKNKTVLLKNIAITESAFDPIAVSSSVSVSSLESAENTTTTSYNATTVYTEVDAENVSKITEDDSSDVSPAYLQKEPIKEEETVEYSDNNTKDKLAPNNIGTIAVIIIVVAMIAWAFVL